MLKENKNHGRKTNSPNEYFWWSILSFSQIGDDVPRERKMI
jgi:hypothetical protein